MPDYPNKNPEETTAHYLYRLLYQENLGTEDLASALSGADLQAADLVIVAANEAKRRKEDLTVDIEADVFRKVIDTDELDEEVSDEEIRGFIQGILDSEGFKKLLLSEAQYWFLRDLEDNSLQS